MILVRLLTAGKSFIGLTDQGNRYRVLDQALPKFEPKRNPFREPDSADAGGSTGSDGQQVPKPSGSHWYKRLFGRFGRKARVGSRVPDFRKASKTTPVPVQGELSLDQVRVVRNDLSDSDFEVIARGKTPEAKTLVKAKRAASAGGSSDRAWGRVSLRIFGAGKAS